MKLKSQVHETHSNRRLLSRRILNVILLGFLALASLANGQVEDIVVGIVPTCPYGISACWAGAHEALSHMEGIASVDQRPDSNTCTAHIRLKSPGLPNPDKLRAQFESFVGKVYIFRGVEVTVVGNLKEENHTLGVQLPESKELLPLVSVENKLQWHFKEQKPDLVKPEEHSAFQQLIKKNDEVKASAALRMGEDVTAVRITGPLKMTDKGPVLEVREFSMAKMNPSPH